MFETLLPKGSHEFSSHSRNDAKEEQDGCVSDPRQLNPQIKDHMGNQFPFTTGSSKQAVNLAGTVLAIWSLSLGIVHCFDLFGMIYSFNVLKGKKSLGQIQMQIRGAFVRSFQEGQAVYFS